MLVKIHRSYRSVVAICDSGLVGKKFEDSKRCIELSQNFFGGEEKTEAEVLELIQKESAEDATFNMVGGRAVAVALKSGIIKKSGIITIQGVPVALALL